MWILSHTPLWIFHLAVLAGVLGLVASAVLKFIPLVSTYRLPIQIASGFILLVGVFFQGAISTQRVWEDKVKDLESKLAIAEEKSKLANEQIKNSFKETARTVQTVRTSIEQKIKEVSGKLDKSCEVPTEAVELLNQAAKPPVKVKK